MMQEQMTLFSDDKTELEKYRVKCFSADNFSNQSERLLLEEMFLPITEISNEFDRRSVSFQLSKKNNIYRWLKYKEGFSAELVNTLLEKFNVCRGNILLDPFLGSGTTSLVCKLQGLNFIGFDILPLSKVSFNAKENIFRYNLLELQDVVDKLCALTIPSKYKISVKYMNITQGAYPEHTERDLSFISSWIHKLSLSTESYNLIILCILNTLEKISFTAKDGQYLRWDYRSVKMLKAQKVRLDKGMPEHVKKLDKGVLPSLKDSLIYELENAINDIKHFTRMRTPQYDTDARFILGSALFELQNIEDNLINCVITSPPYCNRYDYTRTYALELSYLNIDDEQIKKLRQSLLSCTVENKSKLDAIKIHYSKLDKLDFFHNVMDIVNNNKCLKEINDALIKRSNNNEINNKGILRMVEGYFTELAFIYAEIARVCKPGAYIAFVNDNVRYGGEVIPVDFLSCDFASKLGLTPTKVYVLKQQKGNSSQQMKKFGRVPLRKSITIWKK